MTPEEQEKRGITLQHFQNQMLQVKPQSKWAELAQPDIECNSTRPLDKPAESNASSTSVLLSSHQADIYTCPSSCLVTLIFIFLASIRKAAEPTPVAHLPSSSLGAHSIIAPCQHASLTPPPHPGRENLFLLGAQSACCSSVDALPGPLSRVS